MPEPALTTVPYGRQWSEQWQKESAVISLPGAIWGRVCACEEALLPKGKNVKCCFFFRYGFVLMSLHVSKQQQKKKERERKRQASL